MVIEVRSDVPSVQKVLNEVQSQIDRIPVLDLAEEPEVQQVTFRNKAITVGVIQENSSAPDAELQLREITEQVRDDLLLIPQISQAEITGERKYQIDVEIPEKTLRQYGLNSDRRVAPYSSEESRTAGRDDSGSGRNVSASRQRQASSGRLPLRSP